jgi:hypothetical protein
VDHRRLAALDLFPADRRVFPPSSRPSISTSIEPVSSRESFLSAAMRLADSLAPVAIHSQSAM